MPDTKQPGPKSSSGQERRRTPRHRVHAPIRVTFGADSVEGSTENFSYNGVLVRASTTFPPVGQDCEFALELPLGTVRAHAKVVRQDTNQQCFALDITRIDSNGQLLLVALILEGDDSD